MKAALKRGLVNGLVTSFWFLSSGFALNSGDWFFYLTH